MRDMNDLFVHDFCPTKIHCRGYVFTISELITIATTKLTHAELIEHTDDEFIRDDRYNGA